MEKALFTVQGKPFFSIGGQTNNSTSGDEGRLEHAMKTVHGIGMNTIATPGHLGASGTEGGRLRFHTGGSDGGHGEKIRPASDHSLVSAPGRMVILITCRSG